MDFHKSFWEDGERNSGESRALAEFTFVSWVRHMVYKEIQIFMLFVQNKKTMLWKIK